MYSRLNSCNKQQCQQNVVFPKPRVLLLLHRYFDGDVVPTNERDKNLRDVEEAIFVLVLLVDAAHQRRCGRQHFIDENEDGLLGRKLDALADYVDKLSDGQVGRHQILLLVDRGNIGFLDLLADHLGVEEARSVSVLSS
jgi:hypothetical protein